MIDIHFVVCAEHMRFSHTVCMLASNMLVHSGSYNPDDFENISCPFVSHFFKTLNKYVILMVYTYTYFINNLKVTDSASI